MKLPICPYCSTSSKMITGRSMYPGRKDLWNRTFYHCAPCDAHVGTHQGTKLPLGRLANAELRAAKQQAHAAFDPIWRRLIDEGHKKSLARAAAYRWLTTTLRLQRGECHIGMFDLSLCRQVIEVCQQDPLPSLRTQIAGLASRQRGISV